MKTIRFTFITCVLCLFSIFSSAQIKITTYNLQDTVYRLYVDTCLKNQRILLSTAVYKKNGKRSFYKANLEMYNLQTQKPEWKMSQENSNLMTLPEGILWSKSRPFWAGLELIDYKTGESLWSTKGFYCGLDPRHSGLFMTETSAFLETKLSYYDIKTGKLRWSAKKAIAGQWNQFDYLNDSVICVASNQGIQNIYLPTGKIETHRIDAVSSWSLKGTKALSNLIFRDSNYYMVDREKIFCLDKNLNEVWSTPLPKKSASLSHISIDSLNVYMINYGVGSDWMYRHEGYPFVAAFNKQTGKQLYLTQMSDANTTMLAFFAMGDTHYLLFGDKIASHRNSPNATINTVSWDVNKYGTLRGMQNYETYVLDATDSLQYHKLPSDSLLIVYTSNGTICALDPQDMRVVNAYPNASYRMVIARYNKKKVLENGLGKLIIIDDKGRRLQTVDHLKGQLYQSGSHLYSLKDNSMGFVDIEL